MLGVSVVEAVLGLQVGLRVPVSILVFRAAFCLAFQAVEHDVHGALATMDCRSAATLMRIAAAEAWAAALIAAARLAACQCHARAAVTEDGAASLDVTCHAFERGGDAARKGGSDACASSTHALRQRLATEAHGMAWPHITTVRHAGHPGRHVVLAAVAGEGRCGESWVRCRWAGGQSWVRFRSLVVVLDIGPVKVRERLARK